ncbi:MAG TPA: pitrilysin family protein [Pirellulales bacterium]|nr:pitrilysin family protein [Pirellulales bacterium]
MPYALRSLRWIALLGSVGFAFAQPAAAEIKKVVSIEGITEYRLDNGLQVLLYPDDSKPTVTVNLTVFVGSRHEGYGEAGMAHLLEHMLFKGTPDHPEIPKVLQERGARFNGTTWVDRTNYYETLPAGDENLQFGLRLEADRLLNSFVKQEDLLSEMTVVRNEFERGENSPVGVLDERLMAVAFDWHNYGKSTIGNRSDIERVPIVNLKAFYRKYYQPDNAMLVVAGEFDHDKALEYVEEYFGTLKKPERKLDKTYTEEPPQDGERTVTLRRVGDVGVASAMYHVPSGGHPDSAALAVLGEVLGAEPSGRLYKALVETRKATSVAAGAVSFHDPGVFQVQAEVRREDSLEGAKDILLKTTEDVGREGVDKTEVERARVKLLKQRELAAADTSRIAVQLSEWAGQGDWRLYFLHRDRIEQVTPAAVQEVAEKYLKPNNRTVGLFVPTEKTQKTPIPETPDLSKLFADYKGRETIVEGEAFDVSPANIEKHVQRSALPEGVKLALLPKKTRGETVNLRLTLRYGDLENLKGLVVASELLPHLMIRGTKNLSRQELQDELDKLSATLHATGEAGKAVFTLQTKRQHFVEVLDLLRQVLREPALAEDEFEVLRRESLAKLEEQLTDPQTLAIIRLRRTVSPYGKDDVRYDPTVDEDIERAKALSLDQLQSLYGDYLGAQVAEAAVVGDFDADECLASLQKMFADWTAEKSYARLPKLDFPKVKGGDQEILTPDKANAMYFAGIVFPMQDTDPDYPALLAGNYVLGAGALSSRLGDRVRQKEGLSYGVGSHVFAESLDKRASLTLYAIYNPANVAKVKTAIREELDRLIEDGVKSDELSRAKSGYIQEHEVSRTSDANLASILADTLYLDRTMAYYADLEKKLDALTPDDVLAALQKYIDPERLSTVAAGDFKASEDKAKDAKEKPADKEAAKDGKKEKPAATKSGPAVKKPKVNK